MSKDELFGGREYLTLHGVRPGTALTESPLGAYVLEVMPSDLVMVQEEKMSLGDLADKQGEVLEVAASAIAEVSDPKTAKVTQMDLLFMFGGYIPAGPDMETVAPPLLRPLINDQATRFSEVDPFMSYELIIDANAMDYFNTGRARTFTAGDMSLFERDFYVGHYLSEPYVKATADLLRGIVERPNQPDISEPLQASLEHMRTFSGYMGRYHDLPTGYFSYMRRYLNTYADGTKNASGAFMPSVQLAELVLHPPTEMQGRYLDESRRYFPHWSRPVMQDWRERSAAGENIEDLLATGALTLNVEERRRLISVIAAFRTFRMQHIAITHKQIESAFPSKEDTKLSTIRKQLEELEIIETPGATGTGGFNIRNLLINSALRLVKLQQRLEQ